MIWRNSFSAIVDIFCKAFTCSCASSSACSSTIPLSYLCCLRPDSPAVLTRSGNLTAVMCLLDPGTLPTASRLAHTNHLSILVRCQRLMVLSEVVRQAVALAYVGRRTWVVQILLDQYSSVFLITGLSSSVQTLVPWHTTFENLTNMNSNSSNDAVCSC